MNPWVRKVWDGWEFLFARVAGIRPVGGGLLRVRLCRFPGPECTAGSARLRPGALVLELHFRNDLAGGVRAGSAAHTAVRLLQGTRDSLIHIAAAIRREPRYAAVEGVFAITLMHRGTQHLGFAVKPLPPSAGTWWLARYLNWLTYVYGGVPGREPALAVIWMSRDDLLRRYGPAPTAAP